MLPHKSSPMDNRLKTGLRPRPALGLSSGVPRPASKSPSSRPSVMQAPVLVLNATFEPINVTAVRRALILMLKGGGAGGRDQPHRGAFHIESPSGAFGYPASQLPAHSPAEQGAFPQEHLIARPKYLCLRCGVPGFRAYPGPRDASVEGRPVVLEESGGLLLYLQQPQGGPHPGRGWDKSFNGDPGRSRCIPPGN